MDNGAWLKRIAVTLTWGALFHIVLAFGVLKEMPQTEDGPSYRAQALQLLDGSAGYFFFPPGTAIAALPWYAVFGTSMAVDHAIATSFWIAFSITSAWLAWLLCPDKRVAWIATIMAAFLPHGMLATCTLSSQPLTAAIVTAAVCFGILAYQRRSVGLWSAASILLATSVVVRPSTLALSAAVAGVILWMRWKHDITAKDASRAVLVLVAAHLCLMLPVMHHNHSHQQGYTLSTNNEWNLLVGNNRYTPDYKTGHFGQRTFDQLPQDARDYLTSVLPHQQPADATYSERLTMKDSALQFILQNPGRTLFRVSNRFRGFWGMDYTASREIQNVYQLPGTSTGALLLIEGGGFLLVLLLALFAFAIGLYDHGKSLLFIVIAATIVPYLIAFSVAKYHTVVLPLLFPPAAFSIVWITSKSRMRDVIANHGITLVIILVAVVLVQAEHIYHIVDNR